ncbi:hypothetical protein D3C80_1373780 [compost metagenome]
MAVTVIHLLEVVDVQQQERQGGAVLAGVFERLLGAFEEVPAVAALGQHVGGGQAMQFAFKLLLLGDVLGDADNDHPLLALALLVDVALVAQPAHLAFGIEDAVLAVFHRALEQHLGEAAFGKLEVVGVDAVTPFVVVGQHQAGRAAKDALVGGAYVQHLTGFPVEGPQHRVNAVQQRAEQLVALAQAGYLALGVE